MTKLIGFLFALVSSLAFAQSYQNQMDGNFQMVFPVTLQTVTVTYTLEWNEKNGVIEGTYRDNYFVNSVPVNGTAGAAGKVFGVPFPRVVQGVSSLSITTNAEFTNGTLQPVTVLVRDNATQTLYAAISTPTVTVRNIEREEEVLCDTGFGALSGYCGLYSGRLSESSDTFNQCNLPAYGFRFEINPDSRVSLFFYYSDTVIGVPAHELGSLPSAPLDPVLNLTARNCGALEGTRFSPENCQRLTLNGTFSETAGLRSFRGTYEIRDEVTSETCTYDLDLQREKSY